MGGGGGGGGSGGAACDGRWCDGASCTFFLAMVQRPQRDIREACTPTKPWRDGALSPSGIAEGERLRHEPLACVAADPTKGWWRSQCAS